MQNQSKVFRQKSLDRISSPEELDKYIKTTSPAFLILLLSVTIFLVGIILWAVIGKIETKSEVGFIVDNNVGMTYIKEEDYEKIQDETYVEIDGVVYEIKSVESAPKQADSVSDVYLLHAADIKEGEWYYVVYVNINLANGNYKGKIVYEKISPISFIF